MSEADEQPRDLEFDIVDVDVRAVSYTHLDVYKRQSLVFTSGIGSCMS